MDPAAPRARLAEVERELARLARQHDQAMSAFRFDEAKAVQERIAPLECERATLTAALPPAPPAHASVPWHIVNRRGRPGRRPR